MIQWVVCDLDGTLFKYDGKTIEASSNTIDIINKLKKQNKVKFTFATGRHYLNALNLLKNEGIEFDNDDFIVGLNGSQIYSFKKQALIFEKTIKNQDLLVINDFINDLEQQYPDKFLIMFYGLDNDIIFFEHKHNNFDALVQDAIMFHGKNNEFKFKYTKDIKDVGDVFKAIIYIKDKNFKYDDLKKILTNLAKNKFEITKSTTYLIELLPKNINKSNALEYINQNFYNVDKNDILAFGDSLNDYEMFKFAKTSVTRINADEKLKAIADYVLDADESDFVGDGLELLVNS